MGEAGGRLYLRLSQQLLCIRICGIPEARNPLHRRRHCCKHFPNGLKCEPFPPGICLNRSPDTVGGNLPGSRKFHNSEILLIFVSLNLSVNTVRIVRVDLLAAGQQRHLMTCAGKIQRCFTPGVTAAYHHHPMPQLLFVSEHRVYRPDIAAIRPRDGKCTRFGPHGTDNGVIASARICSGVASTPRCTFAPQVSA